jgi:hypothetical protein
MQDGSPFGPTVREVDERRTAMNAISATRRDIVSIATLSDPPPEDVEAQAVLSNT